MKYLAVTGCAGFMGRVLTRKLLQAGHYVYGIDALTYAAEPSCIEAFAVAHYGQFSFINGDIRGLERWPDVDAIIHLAAETHVDNSIGSPDAFITTNVLGTAHLLEMTRAKAQHGMPLFIHVSTDEVYGSVEEGAATEEAPFRPSSPYSASKAAADLMVQAWGQTYSMPYAILRATNTYGERQYPEKLVPKAVRSVVLGRPIPIHGDGSQTRCWLSVHDFASAVMFVLDRGLTGIFNVGGNTEASVRDVVNRVLALAESGHGAGFQTGFERPACDRRYAVDDRALRAAGWQPTGDFWADLPGLVASEKARFRF